MHVDSCLKIACHVAQNIVVRYAPSKSVSPLARGWIASFLQPERGLISFAYSAYQSIDSHLQRPPTAAQWLAQNQSTAVLKMSLDKTSVKKSGFLAKLTITSLIQ